MDVDIELYRREVRLSSQPMLRLSAIDIAPDYHRRTIVFIHGLGGNATQWRYQLQKLSGESRVIALDLRGHGQSDKPRSDYDMHTLVNDLVLALAVLGVEGKLVMIGHSFGCAILTEYAAAHPDRVDRLVLIAGAGEYKLPPTIAFALQLPEWLLAAAFAVYVHRMIASTAYVLKTMNHNALAVWNGWSLMRGLTMRVLVIRGSRDQVLDPRVYAEVAKVIPLAEEVDVGVSAHMVMLERREAVNRAIERFIRDDERPANSSSSSHSRESQAEADQRQLRQERIWLDH